MPSIAAMYSADDFGLLVFFLTILNIINVIGGDELGNTFLIDQNKKKINNINNIYIRILSYLLLIITTGTIAFGLIYKLSFELIFTASITLVASTYRYYAVAHIRYNNNYNKLFISAIFYIFGALVGIILSKYLYNMFLPLLLSELSAVIYIIITNNTKTNWFASINAEELKSAFQNYIMLASSSMFMIAASYIDRYLLFLRGDLRELSIYYSISAISKAMAMLANPISSYIMANNSMNSTDKNNINSGNIHLKRSVGLIIGGILLSIIITFQTNKWLYPQYHNEGLKIIIPLCVANVFGMAGIIFKPLLLFKVKAKYITITNIAYLIMFIVLSVGLLSTNGVVGFSYGIMLTRILQYIIYLIIYNKKHFALAA